MLQPFIHALNAQRNILASSSPRRRDILGNISLKFEVIPSTFEENVDKSKFPKPYDYVLETARLKTEEVASRISQSKPPPDLIIGADTVVSQGSEIFEKPKDRQDAVRILSLLSGKAHSVFTGVVLFVPATSKALRDGTEVLNGSFRYRSFVEKTDVIMVDMSEDVINTYIDTGEPMDKAGGYGIQAVGGTLVERIEGDYFNVMGFPLCRFARELSNIYDFLPKNSVHSAGDSDQIS